MKIAYFVWEYPPRLVGGLGTYATDITRKLKELGNDICVFTLNSGDLPTSENMNGIEVHSPKIVDATHVISAFISEELKKWGTGLKFFNDIFVYNLLSASKFINQVSLKNNFDLVVIHDWLSAMAGLIIKGSLKLPVVFHVHSTEEQRTGDGSSIIKELEKRMASQADMVITVSYSMRDHLISLGYPKEKINVVWNGCDPELYDPKKVDQNLVNYLKEMYEIKEGERVILFIGRLTWIKGVENLVLAFPEVLKDFPNTKLIILGKGEEHDDLIELCERLKIKDKVKIRSEFVSVKERIAHYALADVCVFPSFAEPFGIVSLEAMSMEKPVVVGATGISGFKEQVIYGGENECGVHVDGKNVESIAAGIKEVLGDPERARRMGLNGRKRVIEYFSIDKVAKVTLDLYKKIAGKA
jgi:glycosyltransferase involved in cell wall biosynthesis